MTAMTVKSTASWVLVAILIPVAAYFQVKLWHERQEAQLIQSNLRARWHAMPEGMIICNEKGVVIDVNYELTHIMGWSADELLERPLASILPEEEAKKHVEGQKRFIESLKATPGNWKLTKQITNGRAYTRNGEIVNVLVLMRAISFNGHVEQIAVIRRAEPPVPTLEPFKPPPIEDNKPNLGILP